MELEIINRKNVWSSLEPEIRKKLHHLKVQYGQLKNGVKYQELKFFLLESMAGEEVHVNGENDNNFQTLSDLKEELETVRENVEDGTEEIQSLYEEYQPVVLEMESLLNEVQSKKQKLIDAYGPDYELILRDLENNSQPPLKENSVPHTDKQLSQHFQDMEYDSSQRCHQLNEIKVQSQFLLHLLGWSQHLKPLTKWCEQMILLVDRLSGVRDLGISGSVWRFSIETPADSSRSALHVTTTVEWRRNARLVDVQVDSSDIGIAGIVQRALATNDIFSLLLNLHNLWTTQCVLLDEIHILRHKYAIDWIEDSSTLHVMFGQVLCELSVDPRYPESREVKLVKITNAALDPHNVKPGQEKPSLTQWLDYLHEKLTSTPAPQNPQMDTSSKYSANQK